MIPDKIAATKFGAIPIKFVLKKCDQQKLPIV